MLNDDNNNNSEKTEVLYEAEVINKKITNCISNANKKIDACHEATTVSLVFPSEAIKKAAYDFVRRGGKIRIVTEITNENISLCKELMALVDIRHLDGIVNNFGVSEKECFIGIAGRDRNQEQQHTIYSNVKSYVEAQQSIFQTIWDRAIPAKQRIREIEEGAKREVIEVIRDPFEIQKINYKLIESAKKEILIIFSTANAFYRQEKAGALELLKEATLVRHVKVRILVPIDNNDNDNNNTVSKRIQQMKNVGIDIRTIKQTFQNKLTTLIVDQSLCLTVELKDDDAKEETSDEVIVGLATYSNSEPTVFSYVSIFENLWIKTQLHKRRRLEEAAPANV
jgi:two-component system, OmpR family, sensor histidine kinase VicK